MTALRRLIAQARQLGVASAASAGVFLRDVGQGLLEVSHNTLALLGLVAVGAVLFIGGRADLRQSIEAQTLDWLQARQDARTDPAELLAAELAEPEAVARPTAASLKELTRQQAAVAVWISCRYHVAPEPISRTSLASVVRRRSFSLSRAVFSCSRAALRSAFWTESRTRSVSNGFCRKS